MEPTLKDLIIALIAAGVLYWFMVSLILGII